MWPGFQRSQALGPATLAFRPTAQKQGIEAMVAPAAGSARRWGSRAGSTTAMFWGLFGGSRERGAHWEGLPMAAHLGGGETTVRRLSGGCWWDWWDRRAPWRDSGALAEGRQLWARGNARWWGPQQMRQWCVTSTPSHEGRLLDDGTSLVGLPGAQGAVPVAWGVVERL
jgi:hypothetical protein